MKIQCNVCELAEATVLCCADEAALCCGCDEKVHAANKLATKHLRVPLSNCSSQMPKCDICQETVGYFFCLEDRALLCRKCDVAIHTVNNLVSAHQRFLLTGVKVGLEPAEPIPSSSSGRLHSGEKAPERDTPNTSAPLSLAGMRLDSHSLSSGSIPLSSAGQESETARTQVGGVGVTAQAELPFAGGSTEGSNHHWQLDELLGLNDFNQGYGFMDNATSKADSGRLGESDGSPILRAVEVGHDSDEYLGQVPDTAWAVPQTPSPPTASGLCWPKYYEDLPEAAVFVPDVCYALPPNLNHIQLRGNSLKRRRQL